ncbi:MAG: YegS/Rv2252/BmrU family lipid kinase [bacterium]
MKKKVIAIINPHSGMFHLARSLTEIESLLQSRFRGIKIYRTRSIRAAKEILRCSRRDGTRLVVVVGGDGSVRTAAQTLTGSKVAIGIIPFGTANNVAISLGIPMLYENAVELIDGTPPAAVDLGKVGRTCFVEAAGVGFYAEALAFYARHRGKSIVRSAYSIARMIQNLTPFEVRLNIDGEAIESRVYQVTFSNLPLYGTGFSIAPDAACDDGMIDVTIIGRMEKEQMLRYILSAKMGTLTKLPQVEVFRGRRIELTVEKPMNFHLDDELRFGDRFIVRVIPDALRVIMPEKK